LQMPEGWISACNCLGAGSAAFQIGAYTGMRIFGHVEMHRTGAAD
jgi:hypothetical protein